jgi:dienelactone hydrolase
MRALAVVAFTVAISVASARAGACPPYTVVPYFEPPAKQLPAKPDSRCNVKDGKCVEIKLTGFLFQPAAGTKGPHPILIDNHGSEAQPTPGCNLAERFTKAGYYVLKPIRRGHQGVDPTGKIVQAPSTGVYYDGYTSTYCTQKGDSNFCKVEYIKRQVGDVEEALTFAKKLPKADPKRLAIIGHSFGGVVSLLTNTKDLGQRAVVAAGAGSETWHSDDNMPPVLVDAVSRAVAPIFLFQPMNDVAIDSTIKLARAAGHACRQYQSALFPAIHETTGADGKPAKNDYSPDAVRVSAHGETMKHDEVWGSAVQDFVDRNLNGAPKANDGLCVGTSHLPD